MVSLAIRELCASRRQRLPGAAPALNAPWAGRIIDCMTDEKAPPPAPSIPELCFDAPLYTRYTQADPVNESVKGDASSLTPGPPPRQIRFPEQIAMYTGKVDRHCIACEKESVFVGIVAIHGGKSQSKAFRCQRDESHFASFYFSFDDTTIRKVGQWPSLRDLQAGSLGGLRKELGKEFASELVTALGLFAHGIGIGSFVYLRRIFEVLIREAERAAIGRGSASEEDLRGLRMAERIKLLRDHLPTALVENASLYSILSTGIHELSEDECREYFPLVRQAIELILRERIERKERVRAEKELAAEVARVNSKLQDDRNG